MSEGREQLSPEVYQIQLVSVYKSIPARNVAADRMAQSVRDVDLSQLHLEESEHYLIDAVKVGIDHTASSELISMKKRLLSDLLSQAKITQASKDKIQQSFEANFAFGRDDAWEIFDFIGVTDNARKEAGIFSTDEETRKQIERKIYWDQVQAYFDLIQDQREDEPTDPIGDQNDFLMRFEREFEAIYGEPITIESPKDLDPHP